MYLEFLAILTDVSLQTKVLHPHIQAAYINELN